MESTMKRLTAAVLAIGFAASGSALAQSAYAPPVGGYYDNGSYNTDGPYNGNDRYNDNDFQRGERQGDAYYDYARVIRVDPVIGGYTSTSNYGAQRCYETRTAGNYQRDGYYGTGGNYSNNSYGNNSYGNNAYGNDRYGNNGYSRNDPYGRSQYGRGSDAGRNVATIVGGIAGAVLGSRVGGGTGTYAATAIGSMVGGMAGRQVYENTKRDRYTPDRIVRVCDPEPVGNGGSRAGAYDSRSSAYDVTYEYSGRRYTRRMDHHPGDRVRVRIDVSPQ